jgi:transcriptional regulator with XRE-family HTH domain
MRWLAERAALSLIYLGEIERGKKYPSAPVLERLAWALDMPLPALLQSIAVALSPEGQQQQLPDAVGGPLPGDAADRYAQPSGTTLTMSRAA